MSTPSDDPPQPSDSSSSVELAGPLDNKDFSSLESILASRREQTPLSPTDGEEQALDSNEVLELQAFSERKDWIVDKIKVLSGMPPIELFAGINSLRSSKEVAPGLPTREELQQWLIEHDKIEKETEVFDSGELKKFKKFTKAVAKRNLSPEDTDLIELTLTTIYEFDKLLHLLRDRSDNLDLLGVRLTWEEQRAAAWKERQAILSDLEKFLTTRATWSPTVYDSLPVDSPSPQISKLRRDSVASVASATSVASDNTSSFPPGFSRTVRFKLAESLSREAALFSSRISSLHHSKITVAGKALDKLIDRSRKPVPDEILDEQDSLEDQGINEMENVGKFVMNVVTQWRKADEIYVETAKDSAAAQALYDEIEAAKLGHPSARQDAAFLSRASAITKRFLTRGNSLSSSSTLPRPSHSLFPAQAAANKEIAQLLSSELTSAMDLGRMAEKSAREYHTRFEAVKRVEVLCSAASNLSEKYDSILERFMTGITGSDGDGSPPNLTTPDCLDVTRHSAFLAHLSNLIRELEAADQEAEALLPNARAALLVTEQFPIDPAFKADALSAIDRLSSLKAQAHDVRNDVEAQADLLRGMRKKWTLAGSILRELESVRGEIADAMEHNRWRQKSISNGAPLTPESPSSPVLSAVIPSSQPLERVETLDSRLNQEILPYISSLPPSLDPAVRVYMAERFQGLSAFVDQIKKMIYLSERIQQQASGMTEIQDNMHTFQRRFAEIENHFEAAAESVLTTGPTVNSMDNSLDQGLTEDTAQLQAEVHRFIDDLSNRVTLVASSLRAEGQGPPVKRRFSIGGQLSMDMLRTTPPLELPFDLNDLDESVRHDSNTYALNLMNNISALQRKAEYLRLARMARTVDAKVEDLNKAIDLASTDLATLHDLSEIPPSSPAETLTRLAIVAEKVKQFSDDRRSNLSQSFAPIRELIGNMGESVKRCESPLGRNLHQERSRQLEDAQARLERWLQSVETKNTEITDAQKVARERLQEEERLQAEKERMLAEEKAKLERERLEAEEQDRLEKERLIAEEQARLEKERLEVEEKRLEAQRLLEEEERVQREKQLEEERRKEAEERQRLEEERLRAEEEARQERERLQAEIVRLQVQGQETERRSEEELAKRQALEAELEAERSRRVAASEKDDNEDVFGLRVAPSTANGSLSEEDSNMQSQIQSLRARLRAMNLHTLARPSAIAPSLPSKEQSDTMSAEFSTIVTDTDALPASVPAQTVDAELRSLRTEVQASGQLILRLQDLAQMAHAVQECDAALSDLLEHIDSYPKLPEGTLSSAHVSSPVLPPDEQLTARLSFTHGLVTDMDARHAVVAEDPRASSERERLFQTWNELESMASDLIQETQEKTQEKTSRPTSAVSSSSRSGRASRSSMDSSKPETRRKSSHFSTLSVGLPPRGRGGLLKPPPAASSRRVASSREDKSPNRPSSRASMMSTRSVSGPMGTSSRLTQSTFASRQRTTSLTASEATATPKLQPLQPKQLFNMPSRARRQSGTSTRAVSPALSEISSLSRSFGARPSRLSFSKSSSTLPQRPRASLSSLHHNSPPSKIPKPRKKYVANPKNKLDVAVGDVVNALPVNINIEVVQDGWKDQSGKYWIGGDDPKLCFCRILRSHTVMVRVGGGWMELSKFIKTHFADMFRLFPTETTSPRMGSREEKWISSKTLLDAPDIVSSPPRAPKTPEPHGTPPLPTFALSTPSGKSPQSLKTTSSPGSPLTPLQFMRRADGENTHAALRPVTPSRPPSSLRSVQNPPRTATWRP